MSAFDRTISQDTTIYAELPRAYLGVTRLTFSYLHVTVSNFAFQPGHCARQWALGHCCPPADNCIKCCFTQTEFQLSSTKGLEGLEELAASWKARAASQP